MKRATETLRVTDDIIATCGDDKEEAVVMAIAVLACVIEKTAISVPSGVIEESVDKFPGIDVVFGAMQLETEH
jgi:hypothetical protein